MALNLRFKKAGKLLIGQSAESRSLNDDELGIIAQIIKFEQEINYFMFCVAWEGSQSDNFNNNKQMNITLIFEQLFAAYWWVIPAIVDEKQRQVKVRLF